MPHLRGMPQLLLDLFDDIFTPAREPCRPDAAPAAEEPARPVPPAVPMTRARWLASARVTLTRRFAALGFAAIGEIRTHANLRTMVSATRGVVRLHAGYANAPDAVLIAIARFLQRRTPRELRLEARRILLEFPVQGEIPVQLREAAAATRRARTAEPTRPQDAKLVRLLRERHRLLNERHFAGALSDIPLVVSGRMQRKLGHVALEEGRATELAMSRRHLLRDPEPAWMETLLHEMVHQWQAETGRPVDHGTEFRRKAVELGITPRAVRQA